MAQHRLAGCRVSEYAYDIRLHISCVTPCSIGGQVSLMEGLVAAHSQIEAAGVRAVVHAAVAEQAASR